MLVIYMQRNLLWCAHMNIPAKMLPANHAWKIEESLDLYQVEAWGKGYFSINAQGHVVIRRAWSRIARSICWRWCRAQGARPAHAGRHPLLRHPRPPAAASRGSLRHGHPGERLPQPLRRRLSDQGQSAAPGRRGGLPVRQGIRLRSRGRLQTRAFGRDVHHEDAPDRIVVCNGFKDDSYIEAVIIAAKARPYHHPGGGELRGDPRDPEAR